MSGVFGAPFRGQIYPSRYLEMGFLLHGGKVLILRMISCVYFVRVVNCGNQDVSERFGVFRLLLIFLYGGGYRRAGLVDGRSARVPRFRLLERGLWFLVMLP